jgi:hypothetical protein
MGQSLVTMPCRVDLYWRSDGTFFSVLDLVIRPIPLHNHTITALTITIKVLHAYNIVQLLGGCRWDPPRSWWFAESTDIGGLAGHCVTILPG